MGSFYVVLAIFYTLIKASGHKITKQIILFVYLTKNSTFRLQSWTITVTQTGY